LERDNRIVLLFENGIGEYKTTRYRKPDRLVVDLADTKSSVANGSLSLKSFAGEVTVGQLPDKVRVVVEATGGVLPDIEVAVVGGEILLTPASTVAAVPQSTTPLSEEKNVLKLTATHSGIKKQEAGEPSYSRSKTDVISGAPTVEMIDFQLLGSVSRVAIKVSGDVKAEPPVVGNGIVTLTLKNTLLPKQLQRSLETQRFASPLLRITPLMVSGRKGTDTQIRIALRVDAAHTFKREADMLYVDFQHPAGGVLVSSAQNGESEVLSKSSSASAISLAKGTPESSKQTKYTGKKVSLDFDNAEIRHVFRLLADVSGENFVIGDEVKGVLSIKLKDVHWEQALEIIVRNNNLAMVHHGNVVEIMSNQKKIERDKAENDVKLQESRLKLEQKLANETEEGLETIAIQLKHSTAEKIAKSVQIILSQGGAESGTSQSSSNADTRIVRKFTSLIFPEPNTNKLIVRDYISRIPRIRKLIEELDVADNQVLIEARIVEASTSFVQDIGVQWGVHYRDGSASLLGINTLDTAFGGMLNTPVTGTSGTFLDQLKGYGLSSGISFGHLASNIQLDMKIAAAVLKGTVKIISTPKIATSYGEQAIIKQGQKIPYQEAAKDGGTSTKFIDAALVLDVTPSITPGGDVIMKLLVSNDSAGSGSPPPINTKSATTKLTVKDGETAVIGGIYVDSDLDEDRGIPYLSSIPWVGNLFKSNTKNKVKTEMLIFITPRLLNK